MSYRFKMNLWAGVLSVFRFRGLMTSVLVPLEIIRESVTTSLMAKQDYELCLSRGAKKVLMLRKRLTSQLMESA